MNWYSNERLSWVLGRGAVALGLCLIVAAILERWDAGTILVVIGIPVILTTFSLSKHLALRSKTKSGAP